MSVKGFLASASAAGLKKSGKLDLGLIYSRAPAKAAGLFTTNTIPAAPVILCKKYLKIQKSFRAIIVNSGNANCFTGKAGLLDAQATVSSLAKALGLNKESILVASTGIIGKRLDSAKIKKAIPDLLARLSSSGIKQASRAIMTTDTFPKEASVKFKSGKATVNICGIAKGAGMIAPDMATMLSFILTDANIIHAALKKALKIAVEDSFNCITVDGCMSTNDTVLILANGASKNTLISSGKNLALFTRALKIVCLNLAKMIVADAEGATKFIEIQVKQAKSVPEAKTAALAIANSSLFKTAMHGENPNFGRIVAAVGASKIGAKEADLKIKVSPLQKKNIKVEVALGRGKSGATVYTSDLTAEYIKINAEYN